jgi:hypothetical protein
MSNTPTCGCDLPRPVGTSFGGGSGLNASEIEALRAVASSVSRATDAAVAKAIGIKSVDRNVGYPNMDGYGEREGSRPDALQGIDSVSAAFENLDRVCHRTRDQT